MIESRIGSPLAGSTARNGRDRSTRRRSLPFVFLTPAFLVLLAVNAAPIVYAVVTSLQDYYLPFPAKRAFVGVENYANIFGDPRFWNSFKHTLIYVGVCITIQVVLGCFIAVLLSQQKRGVGFIRGVLLLPIIITPIAVAFLWRLMFSPSLGLLNYLLSLLGLGPFEWIYSPSQALPALILVDVWQRTPEMVLILFTGLLAIPDELVEAGKVDGANPWQLFWSIKLPVLKPFLMVGLLFRVIDLAKVFDVIYILTGGGPGVATETLSIYTYTTGFTFLRMGYSSALGLLLFALIVSLALLIIRWGEVKIE